MLKKAGIIRPLVGIQVSEKNRRTAPSSRHPEEEKWVVAAQNGNQDAFDQLVKLHQRAVYRLAYRMVRTHDAADDVAQEAFVRLYRALGRIESHRPLGPWLSRVALNLSMSYLRRQRSQISIDDNPGIEVVILPEDDPQYPSLELRRHKFLARLEKGIAKLPPKFKSVFVLRVQEHRSYEEIAEALGLSLGTVMSRLSRARSRLRKELASELEQLKEL